MDATTHRSTMTPQHSTQHGQGWLAGLNGRWHETAMWLFMIVVLAHWAEHIAQAVQVFVLDMPRPEAGGALGLVWPWLVTSEWMHYGYAIVMLAGLVVLRPGMTGRARFWWSVALWIQVWHHLEHVVLLYQAQTGVYWFGAAVPTSFVQVFVPRVELHLFYNAVVFAPMVVAMLYHLFPSPSEHRALSCSCAKRVTPEP